MLKLSFLVLPFVTTHEQHPNDSHKRTFIYCTKIMSLSLTWFSFYDFDNSTQMQTDNDSPSQRYLANLPQRVQNSWIWKPENKILCDKACEGIFCTKQVCCLLHCWWCLMAHKQKSLINYDCIMPTPPQCL